MDIVLLLARLILAGVFLVAGVAKLADRDGSRQALIGFGVPGGLAQPLAVLLPFAELAVALALLPNGTAWWGGLGAQTLLLLFVIGIAVSMARGQAPDCHCFGQLHSEPAGWSTLIRNTVLAGLAGIVVWGGRDDPGLSPVGWLGDLSGGGTVALVLAIIALLLVVAQSAFLLQLIAQNGRLLTRLERLESVLGLEEADEGEAVAEAASAEPQGLPIGSPAPAFQLTSIDDETLSLDDLRAIGKPLMFIFSDPGCTPCVQLMPEVGAWQRENQDRLTIAVISRGQAEANRVKAAENGITNVLLAEKTDVPQQFRAHGTPAAVLVGVDGTIGSPVAEGTPAIRRLLETALSAPAAAPAPQAPGGGTRADGGAAARPAAPTTAPAQRSPVIGGLAPALRLPDLDGRIVELDDFRGSKTAVLFWSPTCDYSRRLLDELTQWEASPPSGAPKLLVVSAGPAEMNRAAGLRAPVVLDDSFQVGRQFGASGTPSAILVDEHGRIASEVMAGAHGVMTLLNTFGEVGGAGGAVQARGNGAGMGTRSTQSPSAASGGSATRPGAAVALQPGDPAPELRLPDLNGEVVTLAGYRGSPTTVLFWNPNCRFSQGILSDLKAWEDSPPAGAPKLLIVSAGSVEANRELGFRSTVVLDRGFATGRQFGTNGTPSAITIDAEGRIASGLAVGGSAVLNLIGTRQNQTSPASR